MDIAAELSGTDFLRYLWVDNANVVRSKALYLPPLRDEPEAGPQRLERAVQISQAQFALPVTGDSVVVEADLLPTHDVTLVPDWGSLRALPYAPGCAAVACDIFDGAEPWEQDPRGFLRRMSAAASDAGLDVLVGPELEFMLLRDESVAGSGASAAAPAPADSTVFCQDSAADLHAGFLADLAAALTAQGVDLAQVHPESAPGQMEISLRPLPPVAAADAIVATRQTVKAVARAHGMVASFLPIVFGDACASGMHLHLSLAGDEAPDGLGPHGDAFMAGVLEHLVALLAVTAPTPMSLERFRPHFWAGAFAGWGVANKEAPLRVVPRPGGARRDVEFKACDPTANPYTALGCILAAGLAGIGAGASLPEPLVGDPGLLAPEQRAALGIRALPHDSLEVLDAFVADGVLADAMGRAFHGAYAEVKRAEIGGLGPMTADQRRDLLLERY